MLAAGLTLAYLAGFGLPSLLAQPKDAEMERRINAGQKQALGYRLDGRRDRVTRQQAIGIAMEESGGRVLSATTLTEQRGNRHRIRLLLEEGRVTTMIVDDHGRIIAPP